MHETNRHRPDYPSDLNDLQWERIKPLLPSRHRTGRPPRTELREVVNGINYRWTTGCAWRMLPHDLPPWKTVYSYFRRWRRNGTLRTIRDALLRRTKSR